MKITRYNYLLATKSDDEVDEMQKNIIALSALFVVGCSSIPKSVVNKQTAPTAFEKRAKQSAAASSKSGTESLLTSALLKPAPALKILDVSEISTAREHRSNTMGGFAYPPVTSFEKAKAKNSAYVWRMRFTPQERAKMTGDTNDWVGIEPETGRVVAMINP